MSIPTHDQLEARRVELLQQLEALRQRYNATVGALQEVTSWLTVEEPPPDKE